MKDFFSKAVAKVKKDVVENKEELKENLKTAGYIAGGVAAVSLAPVAAVGVVGGLAVKHFVDKKRAQDAAANAELEQKEADIAVKYDEAHQKFTELYTEFNKGCKDEDTREDMLCALSAIAAATAGYDGQIAEEEQQKLDNLKRAVQESNMSQNRKDKVNDFFIHPPKLKDAITYTEKVTGCNKEIFRCMIIMISCCDGEYSDKEQDILTTWDSYHN